ncbi:Atg33p ASCRUDRAFT_71315 [Ascoidea rubescens DSM 1968]|uniref:Uncharacterized protein n=1 Tax=Ascoidea rubescens DSM 1968 TaxID=1344418 RepID=A0A1D2VDU0_9ASCO|nr:hypothetical protein ASCRUDRAFT_71315 [Ascoidea rubescens DSM 1968]ODV59811.1 hypothetical protein ASCRUDRAFT_71315 [Ascoidea rubescens DSM 1968]
MGTCLKVTKVIGTTTLGILAGSLTLQTFSIFPYLSDILPFTKKNDFQDNLNTLTSNIHKLIYSLGSISSSLFLLTFFKSPKRLRHPYLLYASIPVQFALGYLFFKTNLLESKLLSSIETDLGSKTPDPNELIKPQNVEKPKSSDAVKSNPQVSQLKRELREEPSHLDKSGFLKPDINDSAAEKVEEESNEHEHENENENNDDSPTIEKEVENSIYKADAETTLKKIKADYTLITSLVSLSFILSAIGIHGDIRG